MQSTQREPSSRWLKAAAARLFIATAAITLIAGCGDDNNKIGGQSVDQNSPTGTISGQVITTNRKGIADATVTIGSKSTKTDDSGIWEIKNVPVTGTFQAGSNPALSVAITPPTSDFLGATVGVTALASDSCSSQAGGQIGGDTNPVCTFVQNFSVGTGPVPLPELTSTVRGVLRDKNTGDFIGKTLTVDFRAVLADQLPLFPQGITAIYAAGPTPHVESDPDTGEFEFTGIADDACYELVVAGQQLEYQAPGEVKQCPPIAQVGVGTVTFTTQASEGAHTIELGTVLATENTNNDNIAPRVTSVSGVQVQNVATGTLESGLDGTQGIIVTFSEPLARALTEQDIQLRSGAAPNVQALAYSLSNSTATSFTVTTDDPIAENTPFQIRISQLGAKDPSGNQLIACAAAAACVATNDTDPVGFDTAASSFVTLNLQTFNPVSENADAVALLQISDQVDQSPTAPFKSSSAFLDTVIDTGSINDALNRTGVAVPASPRLDGKARALNTLTMIATGQNDPLADLFAATIPGGAVADVASDVARVRITLPANNTPKDVVVWVQRGANVQDALVFPTGNAQNVGSVCTNFPVCTTFRSVYAPGGATSNQVAVNGLGNGASRYVIEPNGDSEFDVFVTGRTAGTRLQPGDHIIVVSRADNGLLGGIAQAQLLDNVVPTVGTQLFANVIQAALGGANLSAGGAILASTSDPHTMLYPVTPQALDSLDTAAGYANDNLKAVIGSSRPAVTALLGGAVTDFNALPGILGTDVVSSALSTIADATSMGGFTTGGFLNNLNRKLGVNFTESVALTGTAPTYNGNAVLSDYLAIPNAADENAAASIAPESILQLVQFKVDNVLALEADGRKGVSAGGALLPTASVLNFTNAVQDLATPANVADADANARIVPVDANPPLMTRAFYDGTNFVFEFDEAIAGDGTIGLLGCAPAAGTINVSAALAAATDPATLTTDRQRLTVPVGFLSPTGGPIPDINTCFAGPAYAEDAYNAANLAGVTTLNTSAVEPKPTHGVVSYQDVSDNSPLKTSWSDWQATSATNGAGIDHAFFAGANIVGPFTITSSECGADFKDTFAGPDFQCDIAFNHPVALCNADAGTGAGLSAYEVVNGSGNPVDLASGLPAFCDGTNLLTEPDLLALIGVIGDAPGNLTPSGIVARNSAGQNVLNPAGGAGDASFMANTIRSVTITFDVTGGPVAAGDEISLDGANGQIFSAFIPTAASAIDKAAFDAQKDASFTAP